MAPSSASAPATQRRPARRSPTPWYLMLLGLVIVASQLSYLRSWLHRGRRAAEPLVEIGEWRARAAAATPADSARLQPVLDMLASRSQPRYVVVSAKNGLGNRLRALASAMAVPPSPLAPHGPALTPSARSLAPPRGRQSLPPHRQLRSAVASQVSRAEERPLLALWEPDLHCNCSLRTLLKGPLPFALVERPPRGAVPGRSPNAQT